MSKCKCCNTEISTLASCPVCGMVSLVESEKDDKFIGEMVRDYLKNLFGDRKLYIITYEYELKGNSFVEPKTEHMELCKLCDYKFGKVIMSDQIFESIPSNKEFTLTIVIKNGSDVELRKELAIKPDAVVPRDRVGVVFGDGLNVGVAVNDAKIACSEMFSVKSKVQ